MLEKALDSCSSLPICQELAPVSPCPGFHTRTGHHCLIYRAFQEHVLHVTQHVKSDFAPFPDALVMDHICVTVPGAFDDDECALLRHMIKTEETRPGGLSGGLTEQNIRACSILWLDDRPDTDWIFRRLARLASDANARSFSFRVDGFDEGVQLIHYDAAIKGSYDWHTDRGRSRQSETRKLSISIQISDEHDYDGGNLELNGDGTPFRAARTLGTAIIFPSFVLHRVTPVTRGERSALVAWLHGPAFR